MDESGRIVDLSVSCRFCGEALVLRLYDDKGWLEHVHGWMTCWLDTDIRSAVETGKRATLPEWYVQGGIAALVDLERELR